MKKLAACLLAVFLLGSTALTVGAAQLEPDSPSGDVAITTQVPDSHTITVSGENMTVSCNGETGNSFSVDRLSQPELRIEPANGYRITGVTLNGEDITAAIVDGVYLLPPIYQDQFLAVTTEAVVQTPEEPPSESPQTGDQSNPLLGALLLLASGISAGILLRCRQKDKQ